VRIPKLTTLACLVALAWAAPNLHSQQTDFGPYKFDLKVRLGFYGGDLQQTKYDNKIIGFGFQAKREMFGPGHAIAAELSWEHLPSRWHNVINFVKHNQDNTNQDWIDKGLLSLHPYWSFDGRKEYAKGMSLLLSYHSKMPSGTGWEPLDQVLNNMEWHAGIRFDRYKVLSEFRWRLMDQSGMESIPPPTGTIPTPPLYVTDPNNPILNQRTIGSQGAFHEEASSLTPGAFAGLRQTINPSFAFECGLRYFGTKHWDMTPGPYFKEDRTHYRISEGSSYGLGVEFAFVIKL